MAITQKCDVCGHKTDSAKRLASCPHCHHLFDRRDNTSGARTFNGDGQYFELSDLPELDGRIYYVEKPMSDYRFTVGEYATRDGRKAGCCVENVSKRGD